MAAPLFSVSLESPPVSNLFGDRSAGSSSYGCTTRQTSNEVHSRQRLSSSIRTVPAEPSDFNPIWSGLLEALPQGVIVAARNLVPIYWNQKGKELCASLAERGFTPVELPPVVTEVCRRLIRENCSEARLLVMECRTAAGQTIRMSVRWFYPTTARETSSSGAVVNLRDKQRQAQDDQQSYILVILENCNDALQEELRIEQKKYDLTEREAEIWMLLRQEYTYQEIARILQISLNTVKTHVKNVYAKRRSFHGQERFWCSE